MVKDRSKIYYGLFSIYPLDSVLQQIVSSVEFQLEKNVESKVTKSILFTKDGNVFCSDTIFTVEHVVYNKSNNFFVRLVVDNPAYSSLETLTVKDPSLRALPITHVLISTSRNELRSEKYGYKIETVVL